MKKTNYHESCFDSMKCDVCDKTGSYMSGRFVSDVLSIDGYLLNAFLCVDCWNTYNSILDLGTEVFADWLKIIEERRNEKTKAP